MRREARLRHLRCSARLRAGGRRRGAPEPARARGEGGGGYLGVRGRRAGARTREAHLLSDAPGRSRPAP